VRRSRLHYLSCVNVESSTDSIPYNRRRHSRYFSSLQLTSYVVQCTFKPRLHDTTCCQTAGRAAVSCIQTFNRLSNRVCQTGYTTRFYNRLYHVNGVLHFARGVADAKCILVTAVCLSVCLSVHRRIFVYCTDPDVTWGMVGGAL